MPDFDIEVFHHMYFDAQLPKHASELSDQQKADLKNALDTAYLKYTDSITHTPDEDGFELVVHDKQVKKMGKAYDDRTTNSNLDSTAVVMAGLRYNKEGKYEPVAIVAFSGGKTYAENCQIREFREATGLNDRKERLCAEEAGMALHPHIRFYKSRAFNRTETGFADKKACCYQGECRQGCYLLLGYMGIEDVTVGSVPELTSKEQGVAEAAYQRSSNAYWTSQKAATSSGSSSSSSSSAGSASSSNANANRFGGKKPNTPGFTKSIKPTFSSSSSTQPASSSSSSVSATKATPSGKK